MKEEAYDDTSKRQRRKKRVRNVEDSYIPTIRAVIASTVVEEKTPRMNGPMTTLPRAFRELRTGSFASAGSDYVALSSIPFYAVQGGERGSDETRPLYD